MKFLSKTDLGVLFESRGRSGTSEELSRHRTHLESFTSSRDLDDESSVGGVWRQVHQPERVPQFNYFLRVVNEKNDALSKIRMCLIATSLNPDSHALYSRRDPIKYHRSLRLL